MGNFSSNRRVSTTLWLHNCNEIEKKLDDNYRRMQIALLNTLRKQHSPPPKKNGSCMATYFPFHKTTMDDEHGTQLEKQGWTHKFKPTSKDLYTSTLFGLWMLSRGAVKDDRNGWWEKEVRTIISLWWWWWWRWWRAAKVFFSQYKCLSWYRIYLIILFLVSYDLKWNVSKSYHMNIELFITCKIVKKTLKHLISSLVKKKCFFLNKKFGLIYFSTNKRKY